MIDTNGKAVMNPASSGFFAESQDANATTKAAIAILIKKNLGITAPLYKVSVLIAL